MLTRQRRLLYLFSIGTFVILLELFALHGTRIYRPSITGAGDSLMAMGNVLTRLGDRLDSSTNQRWETHNVAHPGWRAGIEVLECERSDYFKFRLPWGKRIVWLIAGTNDLGNSVGGEESVEKLLKDIREFFIIQQKAGYSEDDCFYTDLLPRSATRDPTFEADRRQFNVEIDDRLKGLAHVIHSGSNPKLQDPSDSTIYFDGLHPTSRGNQVLADDAMGVMSKYLH